MVVATVAAGLLGVITYALAQAGSPLMQLPLVHALLYMILIVCHGGVRLGRKIYLVDMATSETRATYVAVSNKVIAIAMLFGGLIGVVVDVLNVQNLILL